MDISILVGKTLTSITGLETDSESVEFTCSDGTQYRLYHWQDCCESVSITDVVGDVSDLLNSPITLAEEVSSEGAPPPNKPYVDSYTWTFYKLATIKGYVDVRWLGESNGYYSESVDFKQVK